MVEHVVLMGAPVSTRMERWAMARSSVAGRFVNAYSRRDWVLGLIYRGANGFIKVAINKNLHHLSQRGFYRATYNGKESANY